MCYNILRANGGNKDGSQVIVSVGKSTCPPGLEERKIGKFYYLEVDSPVPREKHTLNSSLDRKGSSYHDILFLCESTTCKSAVYTARNFCSMRYIRFLPPSRVRIKILRAFSPSVVSATVPNSCLLESQTHPIQMVAPTWEMPRVPISFTSSCFFSKTLAALSPSPTYILSLPDSIRDRGTEPGGE